MPAKKKPDAPKAAAPVARKAAPKAAVKSTTTAVRNSAVPKVSAAAASPAAVSVKSTVTHDMIARRAYELYLSGAAGGEKDHWHQAERELKGM